MFISEQNEDVGLNTLSESFIAAWFVIDIPCVFYYDELTEAVCHDHFLMYYSL